VVEDNTNFPGVHELGGLSAEHTWSFNVSRNGGEAVNFDTCGSDYDTWLRIFNADGQEVAQCDDCGDCGGQAGVTTNLTQAGLEPDGNPHTLLVEGYSDRAGRYERAARSLQNPLFSLAKGSFWSVFRDRCHQTYVASACGVPNAVKTRDSYLGLDSDPP